MASDFLDSGLEEGRPPLTGKEATGNSSRPIRFGKYEVTRHIATGGVGAVYQARDTECDRLVALKILQPALAARRGVLERFRREARSVAKLRHENIVALYEFGQFQSAHFLALEFVDGIDLHDHIRHEGQLDVEQARQIILQGTLALQHAHQHRIVHRDIKPSNFLLARVPQRLVIKLTDFGLAMDCGTREDRVTREGTTVGTVDYMAPEQARDSRAADIRSDLFSLGCTWYHMVVGHTPFGGGSLSERIIRILQEDPPDAREANPYVTDETWMILLRLLAKNPDDRYQTPAELLEDLHALKGPPLRSLRERTRRVLAIAAANPRPLPPSLPEPASSSVTELSSELSPESVRLAPIVLGVAAVLMGLILLVLLLFRRPSPTVELPIDSEPATTLRWPVS